MSIFVAGSASTTRDSAAKSTDTVRTRARVSSPEDVGDAADTSVHR